MFSGIGVPSVSYFYNAGCTFTSNNFNRTVSYVTTCNFETDTEYYYNDRSVYSYLLQCTSASSYTSIIPPVGGSPYAVNTYEQIYNSSLKSVLLIYLLLGYLTTNLAVVRLVEFNCFYKTIASVCKTQQLTMAPWVTNRTCFHCLSYYYFRFQIVLLVTVIIVSMSLIRAIIRYHTLMAQ